MKNKTINYLWKTVTVALLTVMLVVGVVYITDAKAIDVQAEEITDVTPENVDYKIIKYPNIEAYRVKDTTTGLYITEIPQYNDNSGEEWLFAGWYKEADLSTHYTRDEQSGEGYAKFVSADILSVKCQLSEGTDASTTQNTVLRCVSSVDSLKYNKIGFDIVERNEDGTLDYENAPKKEDNKVGTRINAKDAKDAYTYSPKVIDTESEYFFSTTITVDKEDFGTRYLIRPYWITKDGTKVYGVSRYASVNEGITNQTIYAAVKMAEPSSTEFGINLQDVEATYLGYDGTYAHFELKVSDRTALNSVTKIDFFDTDDNKFGTYFYRNLLKRYNGSNVDTSWYDAYKDAEGNLTRDEFVIATDADLWGLQYLSAKAGGYNQFGEQSLYLVSDICINDMTVEEMKTALENDQVKDPLVWGGINNSTSYPFEGCFDGQYHTISGMYMSKTNYVGLFCDVANPAVIQNLNITDSYICSATTGNAYVGSIAGRGNGQFINIYSDAEIVASGKGVGGIVGTTSHNNAGVKIKYLDCRFSGKITMDSDSTCGGGIVGLIQYLKNDIAIEDCINDGEIISKNTGTSYVGGLIGDTTKKGITLTDCINIGSLTASGTGVGSLSGGSSTSQEITLSNCYTNINSSSMNAIYDNTTTQATYYEKAVDLKWYKESSAGNIITDADDLYGVYLLSLVKGNLAGEIIRLGGDITVSGTAGTSNWTPIADFAGILDGQGHSISGIHVEATANYAGMFAKVTGATIKNLCVADSTFISSSSYIACIAGQGYGTFEKIQIASNVTVTTNSKSGPAGIIGYVDGGESSFTQCWNAGRITSAMSYASGLIGRTNEKVTIVNCLNTGTITASDNYAGGLIGWHYVAEESRIENCVNTGQIDANGTTGGSLVGNLRKEGAVALTYSYNTYTGAEYAAGTGSAYLRYENATDENSKPDYIEVGELTPSNFEHLDNTIWTLIEGETPSLTCFVTE